MQTSAVLAVFVLGVYMWYRPKGSKTDAKDAPLPSEVIGRGPQSVPRALHLGYTWNEDPFFFLRKL
jgi:hypothetical protein